MRRKSRRDGRETRTARCRIRSDLEALAGGDGQSRKDVGAKVVQLLFELLWYREERECEQRAAGTHTQREKKKKSTRKLRLGSCRLRRRSEEKAKFCENFGFGRGGTKKKSKGWTPSSLGALRCRACFPQTVCLVQKKILVSRISELPYFEFNIHTHIQVLYAPCGGTDAICLARLEVSVFGLDQTEEKSSVRLLLSFFFGFTRRFCHPAPISNPPTFCYCSLLPRRGQPNPCRLSLESEQRLLVLEYGEIRDRLNAKGKREVYVLSVISVWRGEQIGRAHV